jgi:hypothetical protein
MSIGTYSELNDTVTSFLHNSAAADMVPMLIALAEAKFNRVLRVEDMVEEFADSITTPEIDLPADYLEAISLNVGDEDYDYRTRRDFFMLEGNYYTRRGNQLVLASDISDATDVSLFYYARIPALTDSNTTNWLLDVAPDLYLYATLIEAVPYMKLAMDDPRPPQWLAGMTGVIDSINTSDKESRFSGQALTIQAAR